MPHRPRGFIYTFGEICAMHVTSGAVAVRLEEPRMLTRPGVGVRAWTGSALCEDVWRVAMDSECREEIVRVARQLRVNPIHTLLLTRTSFDMPACTALMSRVRGLLDDGVMFAVLDRLPMDEISPGEATQLYWILCSLMSKPVAQRFDGTMTFDVLDRKVAVVPGSGIRPTVTNADLTFHNDNSYNAPQPDYIALLCLNTALLGGLSKVVSVYTVHNRLLEKHGAALERLYRPFWYDRYREHAPGESGVRRGPVFAYDGCGLEARVAIPEIRAGYVLAGEAMDAGTRAAIGALQQVFAEPGLPVEFLLDRGQIQIVNNRFTLHSRTDFVDSEDGSRRRHLVRLWLRNDHSRSYTGRGAA